LDQPPSTLVRRTGVLAAAPLVTVIGTIAIVWLAYQRARQTDDTVLDVYTALIALAVGVTMFCGLWWAITSRNAGALAAWWRSDDPTAHVHLPIWGSVAAVLIGYILFFGALEALIGVVGIVLFTCVLQITVLLVVTRHLSRRLAAGMPEADVDKTIKTALSVVGVALFLHIVVVFVLERTVFTDGLFGEVVVFLVLLLPLTIAQLYAGFAMVYGGGEAIEKTWSAINPRSA
jgi:hypothetical protein